MLTNDQKELGFGFDDDFNWYCEDFPNHDENKNEYTTEELQQMSKPEAYERFTNFTYYGG